MIRHVPPIFEASVSGRKGYSLPEMDIEKTDIKALVPEDLLRKREAELPEVSEVDVVRHFTRLSQLNFGVDEGLYPLGSCTMKYNPKLNEDMAGLPGFTGIHPLQDPDTAQGALALMHHLSEILAEITGMKAFSLQPSAGAHGELAGVMIIKAYHKSRGDTKRTKMIVPDSAHGTNPATSSVAGFDVVEVKSNERGNVDVEELKALMSDEIAGIMLTNPNTLGLFEEDIREIADVIHEAGALLYYDGANANAILGKARPGDMGFDVLHLNLHKSFSTPHGGGGPGSGPVGVCERLEPFLPVPFIEKQEGRYAFSWDRPKSIGKIRSFYGNFGVLVRAYTYIRTMGPDGLNAVAENAVINANYVQSILKGYYDLDFDRICKHEFVLSGRRQHNSSGVSTLDIAKRLIDNGFHPPTVYFPLLVEEAMMIEPPESESKEELDSFIETMISVAKEAKENPEIFADAPYDTIVSRPDETRAARNPVLRWSLEQK